MIIESRRPDSETFYNLMQYIRSLSGPHTVVLRTPDGEVLFPGTFGITPEQDEAHISLILGGARVTYDPGSVDFKAAAADLEL